jgi:ATP-binding protein involved in chromosome partitioning
MNAMLTPEVYATLIERIAEIRDPDLAQSLGELGSVHSITERAEGVLDVYLELIPPIHRALAQHLDRQVAAVVSALVPNMQCIVQARPMVIEPSVPKAILDGVLDTVAVASGKGGVGKSIVAANLAASLMLEGLQIGLLDADIYGPSVPTLFGLEGITLHAEKREDGTIRGYPHEQYGIKIASMGFIMQRDQAAIFRGPMLAGYFRTLVEQIEWGDLDVLVFDLPPGTGDVQLTLAQQVPLSGAVIVTTPQRLALADVRRSIAMFKKLNVDILGIVENMSYYVPPDAPEKRYSIFGEGGGQTLAKEVGVPFLGEIPLHDDIRTACDAGIPVVLDPECNVHVRDAYRAIAHAIIKQLRQRNAQRRREPSVEISL